MGGKRPPKNLYWSSNTFGRGVNYKISQVSTPRLLVVEDYSWLLVEHGVVVELLLLQLELKEEEPAHFFCVPFT